MTEKLILTETVDHVGILTFNRPDKHNAFNDEMGEAFRAALGALSGDPEVRCILLRGAGRSFCSGRDVSVLGRRAQGESDFDFVRHHQDVRLMQLDAPKPVIAALRGYALGGGFEIALAADIRIAASDAEMALPEITYGLLPDTGGTQILTALIGPARTKYLVMTGRRLAAETALQWGVVDFIVAPEALDDEALALARDIAAKPPLALALAKQLVDHLHGAAIRNGFRQELMAQTALFKTEDYQEARRALREQRPPDYKGR